MRHLIDIVKSAYLLEAIKGDYAAYAEVAMQPENEHFVFTCIPMRAGTVRQFLQSHVDKGVIFVESGSPVDVEFWIAGPHRLCDPLHNALRDWAGDHYEGTPVPRETRHGILQKILHW